MVLRDLRRGPFELDGLLVCPMNKAASAKMPRIPSTIRPAIKWPARVTLAAQFPFVPELSDEELNALVEEATVDAYGDEEQLSGFAVMIEDNLAVPFETTVLGVTLTVQKITETESGIVADCVRDGHHQAISLLDLPLPEPPPRGAPWIAAYRRWAVGR